jgi:hypothetical protein
MIHHLALGKHATGDHMPTVGHTVMYLHDLCIIIAETADHYRLVKVGAENGRQFVAPKRLCRVNE